EIDRHNRACLQDQKDEQPVPGSAIEEVKQGESRGGDDEADRTSLVQFWCLLGRVFQFSGKTNKNHLNLVLWFFAQPQRPEEVIREAYHIGDQ
ncbi:MAG: hypothetical protein V2I51_17595, partial [Anderseniella sp.]|nr:hypothetical protein [Anderseniella sp.]